MKSKPGDPKRAVCYVRVSTSKQDLGLKGQRHAIGAYARQHGIRIVRWRSEKVSGATPPEKRRRFLLALADLRATRSGVLLIWKRDRFARGGVVMIAAMEQAIHDQGAELMSTDGVTNGDEPEAELLRRILDAVSAYSRQMTKIRTAQTIAVKRRRGEYTGGPAPFGSRRNGAKIEADPAEAVALKAIRRMHDAGMKSPTIARLLNSDGIACRGAKWHQRTVARLISRGRES